MYNGDVTLAPAVNKRGARTRRCSRAAAAVQQGFTIRWLRKKSHWAGVWRWGTNLVDSHNVVSNDTTQAGRGDSIVAGNCDARVGRRLDEHDHTVPSACFAPRCGCRPPEGLTSSSSSASGLCHLSGREEATAILNHKCAVRRLVIKRAPLTRQGAFGGASCAAFARAHWHDACTVAHASR